MSSSTPEYYEFPSYTPTVHRKSYAAIDPANAANSAAGKVVVITGGGTGVGKGIARAYVQAGARAVAILGRREEVLLAAKQELEAAGSSEILVFQADVVDEEALGAAFRAVAARVGKIDVAVANAGFLPTPSYALTADVDDWFRSFEVNVKGTLLTFRAFMAHRGERDPVFVALNTGAAHGGLFPTNSAYSSSKIGQAHVLAHLQVENPEVRVVQFHPGVIETEMNTKSGMQLKHDDISLPSSFAVWLASPAAAWTGGRFLWAHWDVDELLARKDQILKENHLQMGLMGWPLVAQPVIAS